MIQSNEQIKASDILGLVYPIGSYFFSDNLNTIEDVSNHFSSLGVETTWVKIEGRTLVGAGVVEEDGANYDFGVGDVGGEIQHILTVEEMPSHDHTSEDKYSYINSFCGSGMGTDHSPRQDKGSWNQTRTVTSSATGGDQPHNNMPPYYTTNIYRRIS